MNRIYRCIWSESLRTWIAVSENTKSKGKHHSVCSKLLAAGLLICSPNGWTLPTGEQVVAGQVQVATPNAGQMQINQSSQQAIVNWSGFSIAPSESVNIHQPNASAALLNRVVGMDASVIQGQLNANGQVYLINPNGVLFSKTAQVDVGGLVASTHNISNADFLNGNLHFTQDNANGTVSNQGYIKTPEGGVVALIGTQVSNEGTIETPKGSTILAAGKTVDLDFKGDGLVEVKVPEAALKAQIENKGAILADGGRVVLTVQAAGQLTSTVLNSEGLIQAHSLVERNGEIILEGGSIGVTQVSGKLDVSGKNAGEKGGTIVVTGDKVLIESGAKLDATGNAAGGDILVGGSWQGLDASIRQATATVVKVGAVLEASATESGKGGTVVVWSDVHNANSVTRAYGTFLAKGGIKGGDAGRIETSGHWLDVEGIKVDASSASLGKAGLWLLDPWDVTIAAPSDVNGLFSSGNIWSPNATGSIISPTTIENALNADNSVTITTTGTGTTEAGNITVASSINKTATLGADTTLRLAADNAVIVNTGVSINSNSGKLNVILNADADNNGAGNVQMYSGSAINSNGGNIVLGGGVCTISSCSGAATGYGMPLGQKEGIYLTHAQLNSAGGDIYLNGKGFQGVDNNYGVFLDWTQNIDTRTSTGRGSGEITIAGIGGGAPTTGNLVNSSYGVFINASILYTYNGNITVEGKGGQGNKMGTDNYGIGIIGSGSIFTVSGNGDIEINGEGGKGTSSNHGIRMWENVNYFTTSSGSIFLDGTSGAGVDSLAMSIEKANLTSGGNLTLNPNGGTIQAAMEASVNVTNGTFRLNSGIWSQIGTALPYFCAKDFNITGSTFIRALSGDGTNANPYQLADVYGLQGMGSVGMLGNSYTLANNIDASVTSGWNSGAGFVPVGNNPNSFTGSLDGLNYVVSGLSIDRPINNVGLFGFTGSTSSIKNIGMTGGNLSGQFYTGGLIGHNAGTVSHAYVANDVTGYDYVGGLAGYNSGSISNSYATGRVTGTNYVGGLVGSNGGSINNAYATGVVLGASGFIGGLIGINNGSIGNTYATGNVTGTINTGGLAGSNTGSVANSFWDINSTNQIASAGGIGKTTAEMRQLSTFSNASWSISNIGGSSAVWRIYEGNTNPLLRSFLTPLTINPDGSYSIAAAAGSGHLFGSGTGIYSDQQGYDISSSAEPITLDSTIAAVISTLNTSPVITGAETEQPSSAISDVSDDFTGDSVNSSNSTSSLSRLFPVQEDSKRLITPMLNIKNSAGRVKRLQMSHNRQFLSLLMEDDSVRIWDFQRGVQRQIHPQNKQAPTDISHVDDKGELLSIVSQTGINAYDVISSSDEMSLKESNIKYFTSSNDGNLLLVNSGVKLSLWDNKQNKVLWQLPYQRGEISNLALTGNKRYGAVLSHQQGAYLLAANLKLQPLADALDIVDLGSGKVVKSLPNIGEEVVFMRFKDNDTLQLGLASGEMQDWSISKNGSKTVGTLAETVTKMDTVKNTYTYVLKDGTVQVADGQGQIKLSIKNQENPFQYALLLEEGRKLLTVMANGDLSLWDVALGKKMLRLFSMQENGWTVMDAFGRFDGSEESLKHFSWTADKESIPLDSFSENYYEPGLLASVLQNQDYLNNHPEAIRGGINLPPKVSLQLADLQTTGDKVKLQLDLYDRGGGIEKIQVYHNGKLLRNEDVIQSQQIQEEGDTEHRELTLNITSGAGKNTLRVTASNNMGIESSSPELSFDGKTKAFSSAMRLLTVGINQYGDNRLNLAYSVADAQSIGEAMKGRANITASKALFDKNATKPKILAELKEISQGSQQDVLVVYFAGHGMVTNKEDKAGKIDKEWYFLPYETKLRDSAEKTSESGITATELSEIFKNSKIQHILLMVDSCYSGAGMDAFDKLQNGQQHFSRQLSRSLGITVITAAARNQEAAELSTLGHGLFTYLVTQELQKKDAKEPVTAHSIKAKIVKDLPIFSRKVAGIIQEPAAYMHGNDFILTNILKKSALDSVKP